VYDPEEKANQRDLHDGHDERPVAGISRRRSIRPSDTFSKADRDFKHHEGRKMYMSGESLIVIVLVGVIAGWLAGQIMRGTGFGLIGDLIIGIIGAFIGGWLLPQLGIHLGAGIVAAIINATIGAMLLLFVLSLVRGGGWGWGRRWGSRW
jgi:uncharacterized membrane protein YeaQ/YmgE (transglycosylase-associated protein family)